MKKCLVRKDFSDYNFRELCGINILSGMTPVILNTQNEEIKEIVGSLSGLTQCDAFENAVPVEISSEGCAIIFDLKTTYEPDRILICGAYDADSDVGLSNYEIYISDTLDALFDRRNCVINYSNASSWNGGEIRNGCDQVLDIEDYSGRFFAIKILLSNPTDSITRITHIGLYNHELTDQITFCEKNFGQSVLQGKIPTAKGTYTADLSCLTDGKCFDKSTRIFLDTDSSYTFKLDSEIVADSFYIVCSDEAMKSCKIYVSKDKDDLLNPENEISTSVFPKPTSHDGTSAAICMTDEPISFSYIAFSFEGAGFLDEVGILPMEVTVDEANIL